MEASDPLGKERKGGTETEGDDPGINIVIVPEVPVHFEGVRHLHNNRPEDPLKILSFNLLITKLSTEMGAAIPRL